MASCVDIKTRARCPIRAEKVDCLLVSEEEIVAGKLSQCGIGLWDEEDVELMDSWLEVQRPFSVPTLYKYSTPRRKHKTTPSSVWQSLEHSSVTSIRQLFPLRPIKGKS